MLKNNFPKKALSLIFGHKSSLAASKYRETVIQTYSMNLFEHIKSLLAQNPAFCQDEKLFKNKIVEAALKMDESLLALLLKDSAAKNHFFFKVGNTMVFDKVKFQKFIANKQFLPNSYTSFKNKIGLSENREEEALAETKNVVLNFPYKDCVLQGGQTKDDQKRDEVFWNETLAAHQIDRLFSPKVLANAKKYDGDGVKNIAKFSKSDNLILKGNNLLSLHSLKKNYTGKIKLIYIDPPYNTGNDGFQYNDNFSHSTWLTFMKNRLEVGWDLLKNDGAIFIQVDDQEFAYLKVLCDELFGRKNFREAIVLKTSTESGVNAINVKRGERLFKVKEYILFYAKSPVFRFNPFYTKAGFNKNYKYEVIKKKGGYQVTDLSKKFKADYEEVNLPQKEKDVLIRQKFINYALKHAEHIYSLEKNIKKAGAGFKGFAQSNKKKSTVEEYLNSKGELKLIYKGGVFVPLQERIVSDDKKNSFGLLASDLWVDIGTTPSTEGGIKFSNGKKPEKLLKRIIEMATKEGDIVLDYHLGSGTTAAVAHKLKRQYIGLEQMDYGKNDSVARLQKVIRGEQSGISKSVKWTGGGSFVYAELAKNNARLIADISEAKNQHSVIAIYETLKNSPFVNYNVDFEVLDKRLDEFKKMSLREQKKLLIEILDKNHLFVNYTEMKDSTYNFDESTFAFNASFYS